MTSTNHRKTLQSKMSKLGHFGEHGAMSEFQITIEHPITVREAARITGYTVRQITRFCLEYQNTEGKSGLKSAKFGDGKTFPWAIEKSAAEEFKKKNENLTKT